MPIPLSYRSLQKINTQPLSPRLETTGSNISSALCSTISSTILPYIINLDSTDAIWITIERRLQATNRSRVIQLKNELHNVSMKNLTKTQYLAQIKAIADNITAAGAHLDDEDIILYTLKGLPPQYQSFKTVIRTQLHPLSLDDFYSLLASEEINTNNEINPAPPVESPTALYSARGRARTPFSRGRGRWTSSPNRRTGTHPSNRTQLPQCQICSKVGHNALQCWHRLNPNYVPPPPPPTAKHSLLPLNLLSQTGSSTQAHLTTLQTPWTTYSKLKAIMVPTQFQLATAALSQFKMLVKASYLHQIVLSIYTLCFTLPISLII